MDEVLSEAQPVGSKARTEEAWSEGKTVEESDGDGSVGVSGPCDEAESDQEDAVRQIRRSTRAATASQG